MLIVCSGPESFNARQKYRELTEAFRVKHDPRSSSIETIMAKEALPEVMSKLCSPTLFTSMKLLRCEYLFSGTTPAQIKKFSVALERDANQTVVLDYEDKELTEKTKSLLPSSLTHLYSFKKLLGADLKQEVVKLCNSKNVNVSIVPKLIESFNDDLWAIDTALQMLQVVNDGSMSSDGLGEGLDSVFSLVDSVLDGRGDWLDKSSQVDSNELLSAVLSQARSWHQLQANEKQNIHPYVQKKLSYKKFADANQRTIAFLRVLSASRSSLAIQQEALQLFG